jgi:thiamine-phosphate pyrophosphorylase
MELIVISNPIAVADECIIINQLFHTGLKYFHIRKPGSEIQTVRELLNGIDPGFYDRIALHQFHEIATEFGIKRLHYTETARKQSNLQRWQLQRDNGFTLSTSIHDITLLPGLKLFKYVFYGPVFDSLSKPGYLSKLPADFNLTRPGINPKVIALGGIEVTNLKKIKTMGFEGAAVLGALWNEPDKAMVRFKEIKETCPINNNND